MIIFFDFDDVLFNTKDFYKSIKNIFLKNGVSEQIFLKYYKDPRLKKEKGTVRKYNPYKQIERMGKLGINTEKIKKDLLKLLKDTRKYVFRDGVRFLEKIKNEDLYIVSYGDSRFQKEKIKGSGISKYFKRISIASSTKAIAIRKILKNKKPKIGEALIFIDDRVKFLKDIKKSYPGMVTILFKSPLGRYDDEKTNYCDFEVKNFGEISKMIKKENE